jgi:hypothetical protein
MKLSNARAEALNTKAKLITRRAYGFHSANGALALIDLTCGPITLTLPHGRRSGGRRRGLKYSLVLQGILRLCGRRTSILSTRVGVTRSLR